MRLASRMHVSNRGMYNHSKGAYLSGRGTLWSPRALTWPSLRPRPGRQGPVVARRTEEGVRLRRPGRLRGPHGWEAAIQDSRLPLPLMALGSYPEVILPRPPSGQLPMLVTSAPGERYRSPDISVQHTRTRWSPPRSQPQPQRLKGASADDSHGGLGPGCVPGPSSTSPSPFYQKPESHSDLPPRFTSGG